MRVAGGLGHGSMDENKLLHVHHHMTKVGPDIFVGAALGDGEAKAGALFVEEGQGLGEFR